MKFIPKTLDYELSPYTGLNRQSWIEAGEYIMEGIFKHIKDFEDPVVIPRTEDEISYPHKNADPKYRLAEEKAEIFEGLTRSFFIAAPLMHCNPQVKAGGYVLRDYYKNQVLRTCTSGDKCCAGTYEELQESTGWADPFRPFQQTVETCALVICLWISKDEIWNTYTKEEKDTIAKFLMSFAKANTVPQNWRLFNMLDLAFLHMEGYEIDKNIMRDHAQAILSYYSGNGWYRDGYGFDYYSCWAFNVYAPLWNIWYGYENEPYLAKKFEEHSNELMKTYPYFFDKEGWTNMWGRSGIYRNAATSAFDGNMFLKDSKADAGMARRISSASLMQFLGREDTFKDGVPTLGFYKQFMPLVQGYSCAESPFWFGKAFLCLHLPADHPFWTEKESLGDWEKLGAKDVKETTLNGPGLCFTNHNSSGETLLRTAKFTKKEADKHTLWNYGKISYNTRFPWESTPVFDKKESEYANEKRSIITGDIESQQYVLKELFSDRVLNVNALFWSGEKEGVLYRRAYFDYNEDTENCWIYGINLADFPVENGLIRVDKHRLFRRPVQFTLGSFGFPDNGTTVIEKQDEKGNKAIILKGKDSQGKDKQMAMTIYYGWKDIDIVKSSGTNPDSENSIVIYGITSFEHQYDASEPYLMISQIITKDSLEDFSDDEIFSIAEIHNSDSAGTGSFGDTIITLKNGRKYTVNFEDMEGNLSL
ncbi:MAG: DUF2264 domain-containing protein [Butyrivibrio sp.]|nr:DUF2264 domain-containing protein [Butyrivibrio sp.]